MDIIKLMAIGHSSLQTDSMQETIVNFAVTNGYGFSAFKNMRKGHMLLVDAVWQHQFSEPSTANSLAKEELSLASALWVLFSGSASISEVDDICLALKSFSHSTDIGRELQEWLLRALIAKRSAIDSSQPWILEHHESEVWDWYWTALRG